MELPRNPDGDAYERIATQAERAFACVILSVVISTAVLMSVFSSDPHLEETRVAIKEHRKLEQEAHELLDVNVLAFRQAEQTLQAMRANAPK